MTKSHHCLSCGTEIQVANSGRPRRYCSAACRQAAYRARALVAAAADRTALAELAVRLRDNADRLWLISQGWSPPGDGTALDTLLTDTVAVAEEMFRLGDGMRDGTSPD
ncbi:hypothetical protein JOF56_005183 [Kibdelosporangium banguiense]|uniref:FCS-type domain-containing protein n=1 Tax=Kibdelosporangium banguiense TaxID=1365924 RepID=A0ABS4TK42_9PSEU|nr:hypothetical protein [Kibdelosporangium banguiense]MBP2324798.1 hypothetical protein [Kibdelosporangium banguiense]